MTVDEFLLQEASLPGYPGACCVIVDRWMNVRCGFSPLDCYGRQIKTDDDVRKWLSEPGGIAVGVNRVMRFCGFAKTNEPAEGDVGLIVTGPIDGKIPLSMAIKGRGGWYSRNSGGLVMAPHEAVWKAWAI